LASPCNVIPKDFARTASRRPIENVALPSYDPNNRQILIDSRGDFMGGCVVGESNAQAGSGGNLPGTSPSGAGVSRVNLPYLGAYGVETLG
jgi:hypothetical protein